MISPTSTSNLNQSSMSQQSDYDSYEDDTAVSNSSPLPEIQFPVIGSQSTPMPQPTDSMQETSANQETSPHTTPPHISLLCKPQPLNPANKETSPSPTPPPMSLLCKPQPNNPAHKETSSHPTPPTIIMLGKPQPLNPAHKETSSHPTPPTINMLCKPQPLNPTNKRNLLQNEQLSQKTSTIPNLNKGFQTIQKPKASVQQ